MTTPKEIKSGAELVTDFLEIMKKKDGANIDILNGLAELHSSGKLTKTRLLQLLEKKRKGLA